MDEVWFDGVEAFPFELWWDVFAYAAGALLSTDPIKKSVITAAVSIIVCFFILIIFLNLKLNNSSIEENLSIDIKVAVVTFEKDFRVDLNSKVQLDYVRRLFH